MMRGESVSVVIPCFNAKRTIGVAIASVLAQGWPGLEIVVVDDGSSDGSAEFVAQAFPQATLVRQANAGAAAARNRGLHAAHGRWIAFLDADDLWLPGKLQAQAEALARVPEARLVCSAWQTWLAESAEPSPQELAALLEGADDPSRWAGPAGWIYPELLLDCAVWTSTVVMARSLLDEIGDFDPSLRIGEDYDLWLRASRVTPVARVDRPCALYRLHPASITHTAAPLENYRSVVVSRALERWGYGHAPAAAVAPARVRRALARSWSDFAVSNLQAGAFARAGRGAWRSLRTDPTHAVAWKVLAKTALCALAPRARGRTT